MMQVRKIAQYRGRLAILCAGLTVSQSVKALDEAALETAHEALVNNRRFDLEYVIDKPEPIKDPSTMNGFGEALSAFFNAIGPFLGFIFWLAVAGFVALILFHIAKEAIRIQKSRRPKAVKEDVPEIIPAYQPHENTANVLLADVDALAAQGLYSEAVHLLLLRTIKDLRANRPKSIPRDLTSREIATLDILSDTGRESFLVIGKRVETGHFGGRPLTETDFKTCRAAYESFAFGKTHHTPRRRQRL